KMGREFHIRVSAFASVVLGLAAAGGIRLSGQTTSPEADRFEAGAGVHETRAQSESSFQLPITSALSAEREPVSPPAPTRSSFMATWERVSSAKGYLLDVSTSSSFHSYVDGYHDLDVANATGRMVTGLNRNTTYYYRVRPYDAAGAGNYSRVMTATTVPTVGLVIQPTFDSSITNDPNAARIQETINRAISIYESLFTDPITIQIRFRYAPALPDGTPLNGLVQSLTVVYGAGWNIWINALRADAKSSNDSVAIASLPATELFPGIVG